MSGLDESGIPLQERIEMENIYEKWRKERAALRMIEDKVFGEGRAEQLRIYASMIGATRAFTHDITTGFNEVVLVDEDISLSGNRRESHRGIFNRLVHRMRGNRSESHGRRNNRSTRESSSPTIDFVA